MIDFCKKLFRKFKRLITYGIMGCINTAVDYLIFTLCYEVIKLPAGVSQCIGYLSGSVSGYLLNSRITFREGRGRTRGQFFQYVGVDVVLALLSSLAMDWAEGRGINAYLTKAVLTVATGLLHYMIYKIFVFQIKKEDSEP